MIIEEGKDLSGAQWAPYHGTRNHSCSSQPPWCSSDVPSACGHWGTASDKKKSEIECSIYANEAFYNYNSWKESIWYLLGTCTYCDGLKLWNGNCSSRKCLLSWTSILPPVIWTLLTFKENWKRLSWQCTWRCLNKSLMGTLTCVDKKWAEIIRTIL